jgi:hypothetical protein
MVHMAFATINAADAPALGSIAVAYIEPAEIGSVWADCAHDIGQALVEYMPGRFSIADCRSLCERNYCQLWLAREGDKIVGSAISEVVMQPQGLAIRLFLTDYAAAWSPYLTSEIEAWADVAGIKTIVTVAPAGLGDMLGKPITTYWRLIGGPLRDVPQTAIPMPSGKVH